MGYSKGHRIYLDTNVSGMWFAGLDYSFNIKSDIAIADNHCEIDIKKIDSYKLCLIDKSGLDQYQA